MRQLLTAAIAALIAAPAHAWSTVVTGGAAMAGAQSGAGRYLGGAGFTNPTEAFIITGLVSGMSAFIVVSIVHIFWVEYKNIFAIPSVWPGIIAGLIMFVVGGLFGMSSV